uniref:Uncharacterized protein n=1 Tax=Arundo donax TaxID=35708 RepID=A0A0A9C0D4_ARUDO
MVYNNPVYVLNLSLCVIGHWETQHTVGKKILSSSIDWKDDLGGVSLGKARRWLHERLTWP